MILCYHSVCAAWQHELAVTPDAFERHVRSLLRRGYRPGCAREALVPGQRAFHVTFDDAYRDIAEALDLLERLEVQATIFVSTAFADGGLPLAVPELEPEASARPERLATMGWGDLRDLVARGFRVGSHTVTHPHLPRLPDDELETELVESRLRCEDELGVACKHLAYPYGEHDDRVRAAARRAGYDAAFGLHERSMASDPFAVPRVDLYRDDSRLEARLKLSRLRRPAYAATRLRAAPWPDPVPYGHGWMVAALPADAERFRVDDPPAAEKLRASGVPLVEDDADVEIGSPSALTGEAPVAISVLAAPPHDADRRLVRAARRLWNWVRIGWLARRTRAAVKRLGYPDVELILWDVAQSLRRRGDRSTRRTLVERFPQRALVIGRRGPPGATLLDAVRRQAELAGATDLAGASPNLRSGGVLILMTDDAVLRAALGPAAGQIERQLNVLDELRAAEPVPLVSERVAWPLASGRAGIAVWSTERRLAGTDVETIGPELLDECVEFLGALHQIGRHAGSPRSLADGAAEVARYRPRRVGDRLQSLAERVDAAVAHLPRGFFHGDFFSGNLLASDGRLTGVIDWDGGRVDGLPLLDLLHLRHTQEQLVPDDDWGWSVVEHLLPWAYGPVDPVTARYCSLVGVEPDSDTLEALVLAYWLDRLAYQIGTHRFRRSQQRWLVRNVDGVLEGISRTGTILSATGEPVGSAR